GPGPASGRRRNAAPGEIHARTPTPCRRYGRPRMAMRPFSYPLRSPDAGGGGEPAADQPASELERLRRELAELRRERDHLQAQIDAIAEVIGAHHSGKIVHDVRNVMNELVLLRKLAELEG